MSLQVQPRFVQWCQRVGHSFQPLPNQFVHIFFLAFNPGRISSNVMFFSFNINNSPLHYNKKTALKRLLTVIYLYLLLPTANHSLQQDKFHTILFLLS